MSAFIFFGEIGSGKTYAATTLAHWLVRRGRKVAHNWAIDWPSEVRHLAVRFEDYNELYGMEDVDVLADEAQNSLGARDWESQPKKIRNWLSQHRHFGNNLLFFTQHYKFVDVYLRRLAPKQAWGVWRLLNLTGATHYPEANPETGETGVPSPLRSRLFLRPWKDLDHPWPIGSIIELLRLSKETPTLYETRDKSLAQELQKKSPDAAGAPPAAETRPPREHPKLL